VGSFDVKRACNNVATETRNQKAAAATDPQDHRSVGSRFLHRQAYIIVNSFTTNVQALSQAELQGSALAPILFLFCNANMVQSAPRHGSLMAFVNNHSAWAVGPSAEENTQVIQEEVVPMLEEWQRTNRAQFEAAKTSLTILHDTRLQVETKPLRFEGGEIALTDKVKLLGATLDKEMWFKTYLADKAGKATKVALTLKGLQCTVPLARISSVKYFAGFFFSYKGPIDACKGPIYACKGPHRCLCEP
jgi:hypothetical protein